MSYNKNAAMEIFDFICKFSKENGYAPSVRDIQKEFNFKSTSTVAYHLDKLQSQNLITKAEGINRSINIVKPNNEIETITNLQTLIPLIGDITAGQPILAQENYQDTYYMPTSLFKGDDLFMLTVHGESMINAGIYDGDKIIVKQQSYANNGEIVAALLDSGATVKRFFKEDNHIRLQPENSTMSPIYCDSVQILGKVVGLIRKF